MNLIFLSAKTDQTNICRVLTKLQPDGLNPKAPNSSAAVETIESQPS